MQCPSCGADAGGKFCSTCGARLNAAACAACGAALSPGAKFCHACGAPARAGGGAARPVQTRNLVPWLLAGGAVVALLVVLVVTLLRPGAAPAPAAGPGPAAGAGPVDLASLSPREAADRLFNRVMSADERGLNDTARFFAPMALSAYGMLDELDADARYHVGLLSLVTDDHASALAQADTLARLVPGHLYAAILRAEVARARGDPAALRAAEQAFLDHYEAEIAAGRREYGEHPGLLERFRAGILEARGDSR